MIEHIAFGIESGGRLLASYTCEDEQSAREMADLFAASGVSVTVLPLYRQPQPTLTDAERDAIEWSINDQIDGGHQNHPAVKEVIVTLRGLLKRLGGEQ